MKRGLLTAAALTFWIAAASPFGATVWSASANAQAAAAPAPSAKPAAGKTQEQMMARVEKRIAHLHAQLKITADQEPQWKQFADVMRDNAQKMHETIVDRAQKFQSMNADESMKSYADMAVQHGANMQRLASAFDTLYNAMTPDQKKVADQVFRGRATRKRRSK